MIERRSLLALLGLAPFAPVSALAILATAAEPKPSASLPTVTYRTTGKWGAGSMDALRATDIDQNFYALEQRLMALEANKILEG